MKTLLSWFVSILLILSSCTNRNNLTAENIVLSPLYASGMVIPSHQNTIIAGHASPGGILSVRISDYEQIAIADDLGYWQVSFPPVRSRHAFTLKIIGADTLITLKDVLPGNIFLTAGSSPGDPLENQSLPSSSLKEQQVQIKVYKLAYPPGFQLTGSWISIDSLPEYEVRHLQVVLRDLPPKMKIIGILDLNYPHAGLRSWLQPESPLRMELEEKEAVRDTVPFLFSHPLLLDSVRLLRDSARAGLEKRIARIWYNDESWKTTALPANFAGLVSKSHKRIIYLRKKIPVSPRFHNEDLTIDLGFPYGVQDYYFNEVRIEPKPGTGRTFLQIPDSLVSTYSNLLCLRLFVREDNAGIYGSTFTCYTTDSVFYTTIQDEWKYNNTFEPDFPPYRAGYRVLPLLHSGRIAEINDFPFSGIFWFDAPAEGIMNRDRITAEVLRYFDPLVKKYILTPPLSALDSIIDPELFSTNDSVLQKMADSIPAEIILLNQTY